MNKHDLHLGCMYLVLGASVGTYGAVAGLTSARYVGGVIGAVAAWFLCRAAVRLVRALQANEWEPTDYSTVHYGGVTMATLGVVGLIQYQQARAIYPSLIGVLVGIGGMFASAGLYERYKREATHS